MLGWLQPPLAQASLVQALPSSWHGAALLTWVQPVSQPSVVQGLPSSQFLFGTPAHCVPRHLSPVVQALPSLQKLPVASWMQPWPGLRLSAVHSLLSLQFGLLAPLHKPDAESHTSIKVHGSRSSHGAFWLTCLHRPAWQTSLVHAMPSSAQGTLPVVPGWLHFLSWQMSCVQGSPSSAHALPLMVGWVQAPLTQTSLVQPRPSSKHGALLSSGGWLHLPSRHLSCVHGSPSPRQALAAPKAWCVQPPLSHTSAVHSLASSAQGTVNETGGWAHLPPAQASEVQGLPSSAHGVVSLICGCVHLPATHTSWEHTSPSSLHAPPSAVGGWLHLPALHTSCVHASPSSMQAPSCGVWTQPPSASQPSSEQASPSSQPSGLPPVHAPWLHLSSWVQLLPSSHGAPLWGVCWQPPPELQASLVHASPSSQLVTLSVEPSQSSSKPLHCSTVGVGASHKGTPPTQAVNTPGHLPNLLVLLHLAVTSKSSGLPLQSSSMPLHSSGLGTGAWQSLRPAPVHDRKPVHTP